QQRNRNYYVNPLINQAQAHGRLLFVALGGYELFAIDTLGANGEAKLLWKQDLTETLPGGLQFSGVRTRMQRQPWGSPKYFPTDQIGNPLGTVGVVSDDAVCFARGKELIAVDPISGETLWR